MNEHRVHQFFQVSVLFKGAHALLECFGGIMLALVSTSSIVNFVNAITQDELIRDPNDFVASHLLALARNFSVQTQHFYAFYLLSHGLLTALLVVGLLRNALWSYPASLIVLALFVVYQLYRFSYTHGVGLFILSFFDVVVMGLIWHEYSLMRRHGATPKV
jgi:uncharacterized membrane protein